MPDRPKYMKGMSQKDMEVMQRLEDKVKAKDGFGREGENQFQEKYSASRRSVFARAKTEPSKALASTSAQASKQETDGYEAIRTVFNKFDADGSGSLDRNEIQRVLSIIGMNACNIDRIFVAMDSDGNGTVDIDEFVTWMKGSQGNGKIVNDAMNGFDSRNDPEEHAIPEETINIPGSAEDTPYKAPQEEIDPYKTPKSRKSVKVSASAVKVTAKPNPSDPSVRAAITQIFDKWDEDGNGQLDKAEFRSALSVSTDLDSATINQMFDCADADKSGYVDIEEFLSWAFKERSSVADFSTISEHRTVSQAAVATVKVRRSVKVAWE
mmetsp:Transcript_1258/g.2622  ORF Transcript_1258/g.2622 Transcript_1258/m.2622 type:complete len:324 (-) Transcript_1258:421-1392(-)|eukprot:CAMPEP_0197700786 /NCGR_PEP_ID=MMETSP1338-20131121/122398_1 /TAXON_ID=43686 ORGANISM="Pelagodinium beii, Strain RCC1491" /NCGR_SAMPLE_ID=MMETSP1338 /ASSEMBLY_ACC=CAM_ASM_000754 /LENGTH=323 /DNA_ID=CAMNT_0043284427 /DNA_START=1 /DNA_END=972 /DNA_ORIENTATION=-